MNSVLTRSCVFELPFGTELKEAGFFGGLVFVDFFIEFRLGELVLALELWPVT